PFLNTNSTHSLTTTVTLGHTYLEFTLVLVTHFKLKKE
ncbi:MAG: hypothetical protein ACJAQ1_001721, partial [Flavobacterium sp.]